MGAEGVAALEEVIQSRLATASRADTVCYSLVEAFPPSSLKTTLQKSKELVIQKYISFKIVSLSFIFFV